MRTLLLFVALGPAALAAQTVAGRVVDSASRRPLGGVRVRLIPGVDAARDTVFAAAVTAEDGAFLLVAPAPPGRTALKSVNAAGSLIAQFVIDTNGRAELATMTMRASPNTAPEFGAATRDGLSRARFSPAVSDGRKVRQLVQLPMTFQLVGRAAPLSLPKTQCAPIGGGPPPLDPKRPAANH